MNKVPHSDGRCRACGDPARLIVELKAVGNYCNTCYWELTEGFIPHVNIAMSGGSYRRPDDDEDDPWLSNARRHAEGDR